MVIGLGSNHGDDRIGWEVVAQLHTIRPTGIQTHCTSDPLTIVDVSTNCSLLIVVDACLGTGLPGTIHRLVWPDTRLAATGGVSSHGVGLVVALRLAEALGKLPPQVIVFAIEADSGEPGSALNPLVEAAIPKVVAMILAEAAP
jgi:hydrogenase maturation protease